MQTSLTLEIDGILIPVKPDAAHEWTLATEQVATGYGVTSQALRMTKQRHADELMEGAHWGVTICDTLGGPQSVVTWTKLGVITLGFFIRSERAKRFRRAAAELILNQTADAAPMMAVVERLVSLQAELLGRVVAIEERLLNPLLPVNGPALPGNRAAAAELVVYRDPRQTDLAAMMDHVLSGAVGPVCHCSMGELADIARESVFLAAYAGAAYDKAAQSRWGKWVRREVVGRVFEDRARRRWLASKGRRGRVSSVEFLQLEAA